MYQSLRAQRLLYHSHISYYVKAGLIDKAIHVFDEMTQSNCRFFIFDYNRFIGVLLRHSRFDLAQHYYYRHVIPDCSPSSPSPTLASSPPSTPSKTSPSSTTFFKTWKLSTSSPTFEPSTFTSISSAGKSLRNRSSTVSHYAGRHPDVITYTIIIDALCKSKRFDEAARFWRALIDKGLSPDYKACAALVVGLCSGGNVELAYELIVSVINRGVKVGSLGFAGGTGR
ncbi:Tetratricopeptide-like helical domain superfamily [Sesbania bispinosa]|nr:Tetratricopeptide-like helical domain superfamily [Sesbania bispinosa]